MTITLRTHGTTRLFVATIDGVEAGLMHCKQPSSDLLIIEHTETHTGFEGKGVGKQLVQAGVEHARQNGLKILPYCPFAKALFERISAWGDVLYHADPA